MASITQDKSVQLARRNVSMFSAASTAGHDRYTQQAFLNDAYYRGEQWTTEEVDQLGDRPNLTLNLIFELVNRLLGLYSGSTYEIHVDPREVGQDSQRTVAMNAMMDYAGDKSGYRYAEAEMFANGIIQNRGYIDSSLGFEDNFLGKISEDSVDPMDIVPDPGAKSYDPEKWAYYLRLGWASLDAIEESYGETSRNAAENSMNSAQQDWGVTGRGAPRNKFAGPDEQYTFSEMYYNSGTEKDPAWKVRIIELNEKKLELRWVLVDPLTGDTDELPVKTTKSVAEERANAEGLELARKKLMTVHQVITAGDNVTLYEGLHSRPFYTLTPFFPFFRGGMTPGFIDQLISPMDLLNKSASQMMHIINTTANSGWVVEDGSLVNINEDDLEDVGSQSMLTLVYKRGSAKPEKIKPNDIPRGIDNLTQLALTMIEKISGIKDIDVSQLNSEPAVKAAMKNAALPFVAIAENLDRTRNIIGEKRMWYLQKYYTGPRRLKIKSVGDTGQETDENLDVNVTDETDITMDKYDIKVTGTSIYEAEDDVNFDQLVVMREKLGIPVPDNMIVKYSNATEKDELALAIEKAGTPSPEEKAMQKRMADLEIAQKEADLDKQRADTQDRAAGSLRILSDVAEKLAVNPQMALILDQLQKGTYTAAQDSAKTADDNAQQMAAEEQMSQMMRQAPEQQTAPGEVA